MIKNFNENPQNPNEDVIISKENLIMNPQFRNIFWEVCKEYAGQDPDVVEYAKIKSNGMLEREGEKARRRESEKARKRDSEKARERERESEGESEGVSEGDRRV